ncbi:MAG TPA: hypothetical protein VOA41_06275 [Candidatus Dormibacteraeota bacterium]|nr:hypothetical protein [Candidatus Dormibacteraeota bacterium]
MRFADGLLALVNYCLCQVGLQFYLWPALSHFRHAEVQMPPVADVIANTIVLPALAALLTASLAGKRGLSLWPYAVGPVGVAGLIFVFAEREFPTSWHEAFGIIGVVVVGVLAATGGAYSARYLVHDRLATTNDERFSADS